MYMSIFPAAAFHEFYEPKLWYYFMVRYAPQRQYHNYSERYPLSQAYVAHDVLEIALFPVFRRCCHYIDMSVVFYDTL
jgi:hypothetical protein